MKLPLKFLLIATAPFVFFDIALASRYYYKSTEISSLDESSITTCLYYSVDVEFQNGISKEDLDICDIDGNRFEIKGIDKKFKERYSKDLISGKTTLLLPNITISKDDKIHIPEGIRPYIKIDDDDESTDNSTNKTNVESQYHILGNRSIFAIRVVSPDTATTISLNEFSNVLYGTGDNEFNIVSQFNACSYGKLVFIPFEGTTETGEKITNGVGQVKIKMNASNEEAALVRKEIVRVATNKYGNLTNQFDHLILCLPPGTHIANDTEWLGYAFINDWLSIYNDYWCRSPSATMHELSHNLGLAHSDPEYGTYDLMGFSYNRSDWPRMCFDGPNSWKLGWYADSHIEINAGEMQDRETQRIDLVGIADYSQRRNRTTIIRIVGIYDNFDYYIYFNRRRGINANTQQGVNRVIVTRRPTGLAHTETSFPQAELGSNDEYFIYNHGERMNVAIWVRFIDFYARPAAFARVFVTKYNKSCLSREFCNDLNSCTIDRCRYEYWWDYYYGFQRSIGLCRHFPIPCSTCGSLIQISLKTNDYPSDLSWQIFNQNRGTQVMAGGPYEKAYTNYNHHRCLEYGQYQFSMEYNKQEDDPEIYISASRGDVTDHFWNQTYFNNSLTSIVFNFAIQNEKNCRDYDGCTKDLYFEDTGICYFQPSECIDCIEVSIVIQTDDHPEETIWKVQNLNSDFDVMGAGPYPAFGRRKAPTEKERGSLTQPWKRLLQDEEREEYVHTKCLEQGKYAFTITDAFGDGICCGEGGGGYTIRTKCTIIQSGGPFADFQSVEFDTALILYV